MGVTVRAKPKRAKTKPQSKRVPGALAKRDMRNLCAPGDLLARLSNNKWVMDEFDAPLPEGSLALAETGYAICLDRLVNGKADAGDIGQLGYLANMTVVLCEHGFGPEYLADAKAAQAALMRAMERGLDGNSFGCSGDEIRALRRVYGIHRGQCEVCGRGHILAASAEIERRQRLGDVACEVVKVKKAA